MSEYQGIASFIKKSESTNRNSFILRNLSASSKPSNKLDLNGLLERLNITNDINLQLKIFSALSAYLMFHKGANKDIIIKCNAVYDKVSKVLSRGLPSKSSEALNFLSTLLYIDNEENITTNKVTLTLYARNMTRVSGCLSAMCEMFSCMMYHDTWRALCQCLALVCSGCEMNQSYCSHLIPVCIKQCNQQNIDILVVLQSLLLNHRRNLQLFLECNGVSIFTRDLLHYDKCLQLLTTVVLFSPTSTSLLQKTNVLADLRDFLRLYGPNSQLGQKAIIILNHINSGLKEKLVKPLASETIISAKKLLTQTNETKHEENELEETKVLIQNVMKEVFKLKKNEFQNRKRIESKSVLDTKQKERLTLHSSRRKQIPDNGKTKFAIKTKETSKLMDDSQRNKNRNYTKELSFSFLQDVDFKVPKQKYFKAQNNVQSSTRIHNDSTERMNIDDLYRNNITFGKTSSDVMKDENPPIALIDFEPVFASTPKQTTECVSNREATPYSHNTFEKQSKEDKFRHLKMKRRQAKKELETNKRSGNFSISARLFSAINDSCTTFFKTVKNIFHKKAKDSDSWNCNITGSTPKADKRSSNYSFVDYMRRRDALMNNNRTSNKVTERSNVTEVIFCNTCDDTEVLKHKLTKDEFLKLTVKKLKLGINLYGCDFKKISKTMWPRESYMTPLVLYNLYRKLLLK